MAFAPLTTPVDDSGFPIGGSSTAPVPAGATTTVVKTGKGRLVSVIVTADAAGGATTIYDNATTSSGTALMVIPGTAKAGTVYPVGAPATNGITAVGQASSPALTLVYS